jgi:uncharacterized protein (TIGR01777 family)
MARVLISGGTGAIGQHLCAHLSRKGHEPALLSRSHPDDSPAYPVYEWDPVKGQLQEGALENCEYLINLAGAGIAEKRWTTSRKMILDQSRVGTTEFLLKKVIEEKPPLKAFISASATGYYSQVTLPDKIFTENDPPGNDFIGQLCQRWEDAALGFEKSGFRTARLRIGIVLMKHHGALEKMAAPVKMGLGAPLGSGKQYIPWIHIDDLVGIIDKAISNDHYDGALNCCAPQAVDNKEFTDALGRILKKRLLPLPVPGFVLRLALGERASLVLEGTRVHPKKLLELGYTFKYPGLETALADILSD